MNHSDRYFFPPEWHPHEATWFTWPHNRDTWPTHLKDVQEALIRVISYISEVENVHIAVKDKETLQVLTDRFSNFSNHEKIFIHLIESNDAWARDHGALFVFDQSANRLALNFKYNAWGGKYPPFDKDNQIPLRMSEIFNAEVIHYDYVLEGGALDFNGAGLLLSTTECLLNSNRNGDHSKGSVQKYLSEIFEIDEIIWLENGIEGDDTDGHIDEIARFISDEKIIIMKEDHSDHANFKNLKKNYQNLKESDLAKIKNIEVISLKMPQTIYDPNVGVLPASYANFYFANEILLFPQFGCKADSYNIGILREHIQDRDIIPFASNALVQGLGGLHCLTQQIPKSN